jgi:hypothetical protein
MTREARLSRTEVVARLRDLAARWGALSPSVLAQRDRLVLRSLRSQFPSFEAACRAAGIAIAAPPARPRPAEGAARSAARPERAAGAMWSRRRVLDELRRLDRSGGSTSWADLMQRGRGDLVAAAAAYAGGLQRARRAAGIRRIERRAPVPRWNKAAIVSAIEQRSRTGQTLASSKAPQHLVAAARWHFGEWTTALAAAGVDAQAVRLRRRAYTKPEIIALVRQLARERQALRSSTLATVVKLDTVRKLFGSVPAAIRAAGFAPGVGHPNQRWSRERVLEELVLRARRGERGLTGGLYRAARLHFGGAHAARAAAGLPIMVRVAWTKPTLIAELQRRARRGNSGRTLWTACKRLFGSVAAARRAAGVPATQRTRGMVAWTAPQLIAELRRRARERRQLSRGLTAGLRRQFGSLTAARAAAGIARRTQRGQRPASR